MTTPDINKLLRARPRYTARGAPLGYHNHDDAPEGARRYCQRIRFVDGDYGSDGTYWGCPMRAQDRLWAVFTADLETLCYYRAATRADALRQHEDGA